MTHPQRHRAEQIRRNRVPLLLSLPITAIEWMPHTNRSAT